MNTTRGIVIICTGHWLYGRLTYNLTLSIKAAGIKEPVCIIYTDSAVSHLNQQQLQIFDERIKIDPTDFRKIRTRLNELSPYDYTLALDADMIWLEKKLDDLWPILEQSPFTISNFGYVSTDGSRDELGNYQFWADFEDIKATYPIEGRVYKTLASFFAFRKGKETDAIFNLWNEIIEKPKCKTWLWNGGVADEFGLNIALNLCGIEPHLNKWQPTTWDAKIEPPVSRKLFYCYNFGGNIRSRKDKELYNLLMKAVCFKMGVRHSFPLESKKEHIPERHNW